MFLHLANSKLSRLKIYEIVIISGLIVVAYFIVVFVIKTSVSDRLRSTIDINNSLTTYFKYMNFIHTG